MRQIIIIVLFFVGQNIISSVNCDTLETVVVTAEDELIALKWTETEPILANEHLPIWIVSRTAKYLFKKDVMKNIGGFTTYHDIKQSSAVVLIHQWNCIFGIIDVRYHIVCLPLDLLSSSHKIGESPYVIIIGVDNFVNHTKLDNIASWDSVDSLDECERHADNFSMLIETLANPDEISINTPRQTDPGSSTLDISHVQPMELLYENKKIIAYPEILILISYEIARSTKSLSTLVLRYIVQLNAVAMLFAKLRQHDIEIYINIAGIVIDRCADTFPSAVLFQRGHPGGELILSAMSDYIATIKDFNERRKPVFPVDAVDMYFLSTMNAWQEREANPGGMSSKANEHSLIRAHFHASCISDWLGAIVDGTDVLQHYVNAAREIAHLMTVENDPPQSSSCCNGKQCYGIMQVGEQHCPKCLTWSPQSVAGFKRFLSTNTNRCFLRNRPRSLYPYGRPIQTLYPADQCLCYGFKPLTNVVHVYSKDGDACGKILKCHNNKSKLRKPMPIPIDGTPCLASPLNFTKVCWRKRCVHV